MSEAVRPFGPGVPSHLLIALKPGQELRDGHPEARMNEFRGDLRERREHEPSQVGAGVRHLQAVVRDHAIVIKQQVKIQRPGPVANISAASVK